MAALIGALRVSLSADTAAFSSGMKRAERQAAGSAGAIQKSLGGVKAAVIGFASGLAVGALAAVAKRALDYAASLGEVAQQLGVTTQQLQVFRYAGSQVGISTEQMDKGLGKLNITLGQAALGAKAPLAAFGVLSKLIGRDIVASSKNAGQAIPLVADGLAKITDRSKRAAIEVALFGRAGAQLDTLLAGGSRAIDELSDAAKKLGIVLSDEQIQNADETADKLDALKQVLEARIAGIVSENAGSIMQLATSFANLAAGMARFWAQNPERAFGLMGAIIGANFGARLGGVPGALIGGGAGYLVGSGSAPDTPASLRRQADYFRQSAQQNARGYGYYRTQDGAKRQRIAAMGGVASNLKRARQLYAQAAELERGGAVAASGTKPPTSVVDVPAFLGSGGGKSRHGPRGKSAEQQAAEAERERKEALRAAYDFASDHRRNEIDILQAQRDVARTAEERYSIDKEILNAEAEQEAAASKLAVDMGDLTQAQADTLQIQRVRLAELKTQAIDERYRHELLEQDNRDAESRAGIERERLDGLARLAETQAERRAIELEILAAAFQERKAALERAQLATDDVREKARLQGQIDALPSLEAGARTGVLRDTAGPMESFLNSLPTTAAKANEALENIAVSGLQSLTDGLTEAIMGARSLGDVFKAVAKQIIADLIRIAIQRTITVGLANALGGSGNSPGGGGGILGKLFSFGTQIAAVAAGAPGGGFGGGMKSTSNLKGFAAGGSFRVGGFAGVDRNILSLNGSPIARVGMGERIRVDSQNDNARIAQIVPSPYFNVVVDGRVVRTAGPMAGRAAVEGSALAQQSIARRQARRIP